MLESASNRKIITVSRHSKYSLLRYYPFLSEDEIEILYPPMKKSGVIDNSEPQILEALNIKKEGYALLVSGGIFYKNALRTAVAYDHIFGIGSDLVSANYKVIITGVDNPADILGHLEHKDNFLILPYVSADLLEILYKNAHTFVFPSLNEGFGYPPLEAMRYRVPCLCAASSSITEVCGEMVIYFNPLFIGEIENRILQSFSGAIREEYKQRIDTNLNKIHQRQANDLERLIHIITEE